MTDKPKVTLDTNEIARMSSEALVKQALAQKPVDRLMLECLGRIEVILEDIVQRLGAHGTASVMLNADGTVTDVSDLVKGIEPTETPFVKASGDKRTGKRKF